MVTVEGAIRPEAQSRARSAVLPAGDIASSRVVGTTAAPMPGATLPPPYMCCCCHVAADSGLHALAECIRQALTLRESDTALRQLVLPSLCDNCLQVFMPWEGVAAQRAGVDLNVFKLADYGIPYCYSPVLAAHPQTLDQNPGLVKAFMAATARGYEYAAEHPAEAAELLCAEVAADLEKVGGLLLV